VTYPRSGALVATLALLGASLVHCSSAAPPDTTPDGAPDDAAAPSDPATSSDTGKTGTHDTGATGDTGTTHDTGATSEAAATLRGCGTEPTGVDASVAEINMCFPDHDGINGGSYTFDLTVDDTGFSKTILSTQNDATVTLTLKNTGTKPHGFVVECTNVTPAYPTVPAGCPDLACFPSNAFIAPLNPGESKTITFDTPTPDQLNYPFSSSDPSDCAVPGLNGANNALQWVLM
jgi:hypothetical protein